MSQCFGPSVLSSIGLPRAAAWAIGLGFAALFGARMTVLTVEWRAWGTEVAAFRVVIAPVTPGDAVLTVHLARAEWSDRWTSIAPVGELSDGTDTEFHLPALLLIERRAWWPFLFDNLSQQPIRTLEPYRTAANLIDATAGPIALVAADAPETRLFTHVLVVGPGAAQMSPAGLRRLTGNGDMALFAVERGGVNQAPPRSPPPGH